MVSVRRRAGDRVNVSGTIGDASLGLAVLQGKPAAAALAGTDPVAREMLIGRYRVPQPRNAPATAVRDFASRIDGRLGRPCRRPDETLRGIRRLGR